MPKIRWGKILLFAACLAPFAWLARRAWNQDLTPNPIEYVTHFTGDWTIRLIVATLAVTPLRKLLNRPGWIRYRRMIGLFAFFYGCLHFLTYLCVDKFFDFHAIAKDIGKRPYITVGFTGFVCLIPLAVTSTAGWIRRLGGKRWQRLHRLIYVTAVAAVIHYYWLVKSDIRLPALYGVLVALLLGYRAGAWNPRKPQPTPK
ncbi:MAG: protein-methionine-sulfoxide reductase heme-binding subunit MsrQ [Bryobacteraceae bacterium]|jgi:sulfoxide reductase heme-binding subunit YedZ